MNLVNRVLIVLFLLVVLIAVTVFAIFPEYAVQQLSDFAEWLSPRVLPELPLIDHLYLIGLAAVVDLAVVLLLTFAPPLCARRSPLPSF